MKDDGFNAFRLPVGWQFLTNDVLGGPIDDANLQEYDDLVQACINSGAAGCIIDIHNYARWNGEVRASVLRCYVILPTHIIGVIDYWTRWSHKRTVRCHLGCYRSQVRQQLKDSLRSVSICFSTETTGH